MFYMLHDMDKYSHQKLKCLNIVVFPLRFLTYIKTYHYLIAASMGEINIRKRTHKEQGGVRSTYWPIPDPITKGQAYH